MIVSVQYATNKNQIKLNIPYSRFCVERHEKCVLTNTNEESFLSLNGARYQYALYHSASLRAAAVPVSKPSFKFVGWCNM